MKDSSKDSKKDLPTEETTNISYAVIRSGGKQYRVAVGEKVKVEKLSGEIGEEVVFPEVLLVKNGSTDLAVATPTVSGISVKGKIVSQDKEPKVVVYKKRRRKGYTKKQGHRQRSTTVQIASLG